MCSGNEETCGCLTFKENLAKILVLAEQIDGYKSRIRELEEQLSAKEARKA
jgi:hypothetical protein